ncbi:hypothetical protein OAT18_03100 [Tenacibaculum sp.]|nr:hypothetical protein [Tenacibaculum sp.]
MKHLYKIIFLFVTSNVFSQVPEYAYLVKTEIRGYLHANTGELYISTDAAGGGSNRYRASFNTDGNIYFDFISLPDNFGEVKLKVYNQAIAAAGFPDCFFERERIVTKANFIQRNLYFIGCSFRQTAYPLHVVGPNTLEPLCKKKTLELKGGYDWQYAIGDLSASSIQWKDLEDAKASITVDIGDVYLKENVDIDNLPFNDVKRKIHFRTGHKASNKYVAARTYDVIPCSPGLTNNPPRSEQTRCSYTKDGSFTIDLDRNLIPNEKLIVTLYGEDGTSPGNYTILKKQKYITNLSANLARDKFSYKWDKELEYGNYKIKYQTLIGNGTLPSSDPSWASLVPSNPIIISKPKVVKFEAKNKKDESCLDEGDGEIEIYNIEGGTEPFFYVITKPSGSNEEVKINGVSVILPGLGKGIYKIKVKDSKGCFAK